MDRHEVFHVSLNLMEGIGFDFVGEMADLWYLPALRSHLVDQCRARGTVGDGLSPVVEFSLLVGELLGTILLLRAGIF